jgi:hypothetical protein
MRHPNIRFFDQASVVTVSLNEPFKLMSTASLKDQAWRLGSPLTDRIIIIDFENFSIHLILMSRSMLKFCSSMIIIRDSIKPGMAK